MIEFRKLDGLEINTIHGAFVAAFADYLVPMQIKEQQLIERFIRNNVKLNLSAGACYNDELIGFICHGEDELKGKKTIYNAGTGVLPQFRGQNLTKKMYEYIIPNLRENKYEQVILEVVTTNDAAIKSYESIGFNKTRLLNCYSGHIKKGMDTAKNITIKEIDEPDYKQLESFWSWQPSWQNSTNALTRIISENKTIGAYKNETLLGYLAYNPASNSISQLAVDPAHRKQKIGTSLLNYVSNTSQGIFHLLNIDAEDAATKDFLQKSGFKNSINQWEMLLIL